MGGGKAVTGDGLPHWPDEAAPTARPERQRPSRRRRQPRGRLGPLLAIAILVAAAILVVVLIVGRKSGPPPPPPTLRITFPEGLTRAQMARQVTAVDSIARRTRQLDPAMTARGYLAATRSWLAPAWFAVPRRRHAVEGFLFPSTYEFLAATPARALVAQQLTAFHDAWTALDLRYARSKNLTPYDVLIIASMVEKEIAAPEERALAAAVIYNRLKARMRLQIDATLVYGFHLAAGAALTGTQLRTDDPFNTYTRSGLPPTPIANPGAAALEAAAHPARVPYLFYVRKPDGVHHFFTASYDAFKRYCRAHGYGAC